jgi:hypothetical protein
MFQCSFSVFNNQALPFSEQARWCAPPASTKAGLVYGLAGKTPLSTCRGTQVFIRLLHRIKAALSGGFLLFDP